MKVFRLTGIERHLGNELRNIEETIQLYKDYEQEIPTHLIVERALIKRRIWTQGTVKTETKKILVRGKPKK